MAGDVAQFLQKKFLASLSETESELSGAVLISDLGAIKDIVISIDTRRLTGDYYCRFISVLLDLTDALTKCQVFSHEWKMHSHHKTHLAVFNHLSLRKICFVWKMKKRLAAIKRIFEAEFMKKEERIYNLRESSSRPYPEENLESELPVVEAEVVGFDEQLWKIRNFLLKPSQSSGAGFGAVGILGIAGAGKTTLVREFLSWWIVRGEFSPIIWLRLSNIIKENKQVEEEIEVSIVKCMLGKLDHDAVVDGDGIIQEKEKTASSNNKSGHLLAALLKRLNQHLSGKRYLIVLDDVWHMNDFYSDLGHLLEVQEVGDRLSHGLPKGSGGAVIVTSRIPEVVEAMVVPAVGSDQHYNSLIIRLEPLDRQSCWGIFKDTVFGYLPDFEYQQHLEKVEIEIKDLCDGLPLAARTLAEIMSHNTHILRWTSPPYRKSEELLQLPDFFFGIPIGRRTYYPPYRKSEEWLQLPDFSFGIPMLVFIDMRREEELIYKFGNHLYSDQVFGVLLEEPNMYNNPETVLKDVYGTLEKLKQNGYYGFASEIQKKMRIIVVGGDDVVNWILGVICDLKLPESPSIAPVPPPTSERWGPWYNENYKFGIAASFGWKDISPLRSFLVDVALAKSMKTDSWHCLIRMKHTQSSTSQQEEPYSSFMDQLPHYLHEVGDVGKADNPILHGRFWYYFMLRVHDSTSRKDDLTLVAKVKVLNHLGQWEMLYISGRINSICCLNLPIFGPRDDRWMTKNTMEDGKTPTNLSFVDDGCLKVIGSKNEFSYGSRDWPLLDQVRGIRFEFKEGAIGLVDLRIDEVMSFRIPTEELVEIEISYHGEVNILAGPNCPAKSIHLSSQSSVSQANVSPTLLEVVDVKKQTSEVFTLGCDLGIYDTSCQA